MGFPDRAAKNTGVQKFRFLRTPGDNTKVNFTAGASDFVAPNLW